MRIISGNINGREYRVVERKRSWNRFFCGYVEIKNDELDLMEIIENKVDKEAYQGVTFTGQHEELDEYKTWIGFDTASMLDDRKTTYANDIDTETALWLTHNFANAVEKAVKELNEKGANTHGALEQLDQARTAIDVAEKLIRYRINEKDNGVWSSESDEDNRHRIIEMITSGISKLECAGNRFIIRQ